MLSTPATSRIVSSDAPLLRQSIYYLHPLYDARWTEFLQRHPCSSVFHSVEWLTALHRTYGYNPIALTTSPPGEPLQNAAVFCRVESWLTGRRLVSLPFSDHCALLIDNDRDLATITSALTERLHRDNLRYVETRPTHAFHTPVLGTHSRDAFYFHLIDLKPDLNALFAALHKSSTQRKIRRAEREKLTYYDGRSDFLLDCFYDLMLLTRRRHAALPHPKKWFKALIECFGEALKIRVAFKDQQPVAAILTLRYKETLVYKYGCSDPRFHRYGGVHLLLWRSIQEAKQQGLRIFDLGRSDCDNAGLIKFKDRWGAHRSLLTYLRLLDLTQSKALFAPTDISWQRRAVKYVLPHLPDAVVRATSTLLCKHIG